jgi:hypothetical protein
MQPSEHGQHGFGTLAVHAGSPHDPVTGAVIESVSTISQVQARLYASGRTSFHQRSEDV